MNRRALQIAREVAQKNGKLFAGGLSNSTIYNPDDKEVHKQVEAMFEVNSSNLWNSLYQVYFVHWLGNTDYDVIYHVNSLNPFVLLESQCVAIWTLYPA